MLKTRIYMPAPLEQAPLVKSTLKYLPIKETCRLSLVSKTWASVQENLTSLYPAEFNLSQSLIKRKFYLWQGRKKSEFPTCKQAFHKIAPLVRHIDLDGCYRKSFDFTIFTNLQAATLWSSDAVNPFNPTSYYLIKQVEELTIFNSLPQYQWPKAWYVSVETSNVLHDITHFAPLVKVLHLKRFPNQNTIISPQIKALWISDFRVGSSTAKRFTANVQSIAIFVIDLSEILEEMIFCWDEDEDFMSDKEKEEVVRDIPQFQRIQNKIDEMAVLKVLIVIRPFGRVPKSVKFFDTSSATQEMDVENFDLQDLKTMLDDLE